MALNANSHLPAARTTEGSRPVRNSATSVAHQVVLLEKARRGLELAEQYYRALHSHHAKLTVGTAVRWRSSHHPQFPTERSGIVTAVLEDGGIEIEGGASERRGCFRAIELQLCDNIPHALNADGRTLEEHRAALTPGEAVTWIVDGNETGAKGTVGRIVGSTEFAFGR